MQLGLGLGLAKVEPRLTQPTEALLLQLSVIVQFLLTRAVIVLLLDSHNATNWDYPLVYIYEPIMSW